MLLCFISDKKLLSFHLKRSNTLPVVMDYIYHEKSNPIMASIAVQTSYDLEWKNYSFTAETLLEAILFNLETGNVVWPGVVSFTNKEEWIKNMRKNPVWYLLTNEGLSNPEFIIDAEDLLFNLASNYLRRQIQLILMLGKGIKAYGKDFLNVKTYKLLSCQQASGHNFFISVYCK